MIHKVPQWFACSLVLTWWLIYRLCASLLTHITHGLTASEASLSSPGLSCLAVFCIRRPRQSGGAGTEQALSSTNTLLETFLSHHKVSIFKYPDFYTNTLLYSYTVILPSFCLCFYHNGVTGTWLNVNVLNLSACLTDRGMLFPSQRLFSSRLSHLIFDIVGRGDLHCSCVKWNISIGNSYYLPLSSASSVSGGFKYSRAYKDLPNNKKNKDEKQ